MLRKTLELKGSVDEATEKERELELKKKLKESLEGAGAYVIDAAPTKIQVMRHQASQLASNKNLNLEELEQMRMENE